MASTCLTPFVSEACAIDSVGFTDAFARRIATFGKVAVAGIKKLVDVATLPEDEEFAPGLQAFFATSGRPEKLPRPELVMTLSRAVRDVVAEHTLFEIEAIDRLLLNLCVSALQLADHLGRPPGTITSGQASYDLRRLKSHGFIQRIPHSHRDRVTDTGLARAMFLARAHDRLLTTGLAELTAPATTNRIQNASPAYQAAIDDLTMRAGLHIAA